MNQLGNDFRYAVRTLLKSPGFALVAIITLALGIGANTAIFSVVKAVLLDPFPYRDHAKLYVFEQSRPTNNVERSRMHSGPEYTEYRQAKSFEQVAALETVSRNVTVGGQQAERVGGAKVTAEFFNTLGVPPVLGRYLLPEEQGQSAPRMIVIGYGLWQRRFGGDREVLGKSLELDAQPYTIVGVMPTRFRYLGTEMWFPFDFELSQAPLGRRWYQIVGRLRADASPEAAAAELETIARRIEHTRTDAQGQYAGWRVSALPLLHAVVGDVRPALLILLGAVGAVLLIACANVTNLLLVRNVGRRHELAIRAALGATRSRLVSQLLCESGVIALLGGGAALLLGVWAVDALMAVLPVGNFLAGGNLPAEAVVAVDKSVLGFTLGLSLLTVIVFGFWPALQASGLGISESLRDAGTRTTAGAARQRARNLLVVSEVAVALVLLVGAGLLVRSLHKLLRIETGFDETNLLTARINLPPAKYRDNSERAAFFARVEQEVGTLPGVKAVSIASHPPFSFTEQWDIALEGETSQSEAQTRTDQRTVSADYHEVMSIPLVRGRAFTPADKEGAPAVAIINETMARQLWPATDPMGKRFRLTTFGPNGPWVTVVGIMRDSAQADLSAPVNREFNVPMAQFAGVFRRMNLMVRTAGNPAPLIDSIRQRVWNVDAQIPLYSVGTIQEAIVSSVGPRRFAMILLGCFAALAVTLTIVGVYAVISFAVSRRTHEIGVRMALGAARSNIFRMVLGEAAGWLALGLGIGIVISVGVTRVLDKLLFGVGANDPLTFVAVAALLALVAMAACYFPARRATKVDPMVALRYE